MPELPEVECIVRSLRPHLEGGRIAAVAFQSPLAAGGRPAEIPQFLTDRSILAVRRRGKFVLLELEDGFCAIHLRMTGRLVWNGAEGPHTRAVFTLESGRLVLDDIRQFARVLAGPTLPEAVARLGPEPFDLTAAEFAQRLRARRGRLKPLLLDQGFLAGLGNIYADEALHRARIHPLQPASRLSVRRMEALHAAIVEVLEEAIAAGGSSISDYVDGAGRAGAFQRFHRVYGREGEPCRQCGAAVRRIVVAQRGTHYCPRCQRLQ
ncbi:MAG: formamidopyrimidine-DNA glycosylase [Bryobacteraceae bacterium]|nr:MAG: formamidopyrimidine-DNA glycosylase [Bryobacteraceae bacterium]